MERQIETLRATPHWSYSALNTYLTCPLKYRFRYVDKLEPERSGACLSFGRAFHSAMSDRAIKGDMLSAPEVKEIFETYFKADVEATDNLTYKTGETFDSMLETGFKMVDAAIDNWQDDFSVKAVAESFSVEVPGLRQPLIGEFDMVVSDGQDICIVDWKTSSAKWPATKADFDLQASAFCYAYREKYQINPVFRFDVVTKTKTPSVTNYYTVRTKDELDCFVYLANEIQRGVDAGIFFPNETGFSCAECSYRDHCKKIHWR